jgi:hypothetical protein
MSPHPAGRWLTVRDAAPLLSMSPDALRRSLERHAVTATPPDTTRHPWYESRLDSIEADQSALTLTLGARARTNAVER